jgi:hypothetical protein
MQTSSLARARAVARPSRDEILKRTMSVQQFWDQNRELFKDAWKDWEGGNGNAPVLDSSLFDTKLRAAVERAWDDPTKEIDVKDLWEEVFPGVYKTQFFDPERLSVLRD